MPNFRSTWYPVCAGELHFTPVAIIECGRVVKVVPASELQNCQIGYLGIDVPNGQKGPADLGEALGMAAVAMM